MANGGKTRYDLERNIGKFGDRSMTRRESKRREKFRSIFRGERGALSTKPKQTMIVFLSRQRNLVFGLFSRVPWGYGEGREKLAARGNRATGTYRHADWKFVRSHAFYAFFQPWNPSRAIPSSRDEHSIPSITDLSSCRHRKNSPLSLFSPRPFPSSFFSLPPPLPFPSPFISFFHPFFPPFLFSTVGRGTACVWRVIDSTSNSIKRENALSAQRRHRFHDWSSPIGPTNGRPWFFLLFPFFGKITATDGKRKKEYLDLRVIFSPFFLFFLSFFLSFHKSKRNSFYLEKKKTRNHSSKEQVNV